MKAVSLFAGAGGSSIGLRRAGLDVVASVDFDTDAVATLKANGFHGVRADVATFPWATVFGGVIDTVEGGPPCQPFSAAGDGAGAADPRDGIPHFIRAVADIRPRVFIMENVRGLTFKRHRPYLEWVLASFRGLGYRVEHRVLNAADYGVPQTRKRLFVVGRLDRDPAWPTPTHAKDGKGGLARWVTMAEALGYEDPEVQLFFGLGSSWTRRLTRPITEPAPTIAFGKNAASWCWERPATTIVGSFSPDVVAAPGYRKAGGPSRQNAPGSVRVTPEEAALLQGFPAAWEFVGSRTSLFKQIGNACPPALTAAVHAAQHKEAVAA